MSDYDGFNNKPDLKINFGGTGPSAIRVFCKNCGANNTLKNAFKKDIHYCTGNKVWAEKFESCSELASTLLRTASNVFFPKIVSSLDIPPYSDELLSRVSETLEFKLLTTQQGFFDDKGYLHKFFVSIAQKLNCSENEVKTAFEILTNSEGVHIQNEEEYRYDEFLALRGIFDEDQNNSRNFTIEVIDSSKSRIPGLESITIVHRLREVRVQTSFSRLSPLDKDIYEDPGSEENTREVLVKENRETDWFPAVEVRGEGIFLTFNEGFLKEWVCRTEEINDRAKILEERAQNLYQKRGLKARNISAQFIMLHTLAHLLIRELSFECGYSAASLKEKIYCSSEDSTSEMYALLIYTASGDSEGTLGGLARLGRPEALGRIIRKAVHNSSWCSSDPLCIESRGQGMDSLNMAACHSCALLPETSCEEFNRLLDRAMIVGTMHNPQIGCFSELFN